MDVSASCNEYTISHNVNKPSPTISENDKGASVLSELFLMKKGAAPFWPTSGDFVCKCISVNMHYHAHTSKRT